MYNYIDIVYRRLYTIHGAHGASFINIKEIMNNEQEIKQMIFVIDDELDNIEISLDRCIESLEFCDDDDHYQYIETISWLNDLNSKKQSLLNKRAGLKNQIITKIGNENVK